jgi:hypothetical protein
MATPTTLPAAFVAGDVLEALQLNNLRGAFRVLQFVVGTNATQAVNATNVFADTGLTATITPSATSSKVAVIVQQSGVAKLAGNIGSGCRLKLFRGATDLGNFQLDAGFTNTSIDNYIGGAGYTVLDTPATTSAVTYKTQFANAVNANGVIVQNSSSKSSIILLEISA